MAPAIGIDLGTTYSCVGIFRDDRIEIIANDQGNRTTPSFVAFTDTERLIGDSAKNQVAMNPTNTVFDAKRLIGRKFADAEVQADMKHFPFKVVEKGGKPVIQVEFKGETKSFTPEEISAMVLTKMRRPLNHTLVALSTTPSSPSQHTSTTLSVKLPKMPDSSLASTSSVSSTNLQPLPSLTVSIRRLKVRETCSYSTWEEEHSMSRS